MSASPQQMQEKLKRWPLVAQPSNRSQSFLKDARLVNAFAEQDPNTGEFQVQKRVGYALDYTIGAAGGNGLWSFSGTTQNVYAVLSTGFPHPTASMYKDGVLFGTAGGLDGQLDRTNYFFVEDQAAAPNRHFIFASQFHVYYTTGTGGWTLGAQPAVVGQVCGLAYLDQTVYLMDSTGNIFGSNFNDPTTWGGANVIIANSIPGYGVQLTKQLNYIIALKSESMEVFYDNANPTGSPLSPVAGALSNYGGVGGTIQTIDDVLLFVTANRTSSPQVVRVDNLQITVISTPSIERLLSPVLQSGVPPAISSWSFKHGGHRFAAWSYFGGGISTSFTIVYDVDQKLWAQWGDQNGYYWPPNAMAVDVGSNHVLQVGGSIYKFDGDYTYPTDNGIVVPVDIYTPNADFGTRRRKTLDRMYIQSDQTPGSLLYISHSDDDYQHWSTPRKVNLGRRTPFIDNEGTFIRRAYHFQHKAPTAFRIRSADLQMRLGTI